jgi:hemerythrin superfamily protein
MSMADVIALITTDHREMEKLFERLKKEKSNRAELLSMVTGMLAAHSRAEEDRVYPAVAKEAGEREEVHHGTEEHHEAEEMARKLEKMDPKSKKFEKLLDEFIEAVQHHIKEEESDILPAMEKAMSKKRLKQLGVAFADRRAEELDRLAKTEGKTAAKAKGTAGSANKKAADKVSAKLAGKVSGKTSGKTSAKAETKAAAKKTAGKTSAKGSAKGSAKAGATKDELLKTARKLDIRGRSKMSKKELEKAVGKAGKR